MVVWHLNSCIFCCQVSAWVMFDDLVRSANQSCCWNSCSPGASGSVNIDAFFFQICYQSAIDSEWKCVHLWMALSTIKTTAFRSCSAAFWHNSQHIRAERETYVKKIPMESLWDSGLENTKEELIWNDSTDDMAPSQARQLGSVSNISNQKWCLFSHACPCSQQSLSSQQLFQWGRWALPTLHLLSCKQIMLRGLDDVCVRNKIIWNQFLWSHCAFSRSSASRYSWGWNCATTGRKLAFTSSAFQMHLWCIVVFCLFCFFVFQSCIYTFCIAHQKCRLRSTCLDNEFWQIQHFLC